MCIYTYIYRAQPRGHLEGALEATSRRGCLEAASRQPAPTHTPTLYINIYIHMYIYVYIYIDTYR